MRFALLIGLFLTIQTAYAAEQPTLVRVTIYCREEGQLRAAWNGARLRNGHCAVDPKKIPYGSRIQLEDEELIAVDTGPAVVRRKAPDGEFHTRWVHRPVTCIPTAPLLTPLFQAAIFISALFLGLSKSPLVTPGDAPIASSSRETLSQGAAADHSIGSVCYK